MGLDSLLIRLKRDVSPVSDVQPNIHAGYSRYGTETAGVSGVSDPALIGAADTSDTAAKNHPYQPEPAWNKACTADTSETCKKINAEPGFSAATQKVATLDPTPAPEKVQAMPPADSASGAVIDIGTVRPPVLTPAMLAASLALDAQIQADGQFDNGDVNPDRWCYPDSTAMNGAELDLLAARLARFTDKGVSQGDAESLADKLVIRDRDSDDRALCLECRHMAGYGRASWRCGNWQAAGVAISQRDSQLPGDLVFQLQRCPGFAPPQRTAP